MWPNSDGVMTGGGGTTGKTALWSAITRTGPVPADWTEENCWTILMDVLTFRCFPTAVSFVAHLALSALSDTQIKKETSARWGKKASDAFLVWHKASMTFLESISTYDEKSPAKAKPASKLPNLSELTGYSKERAKAPAAKAGKARSVPPSIDVLEAAEELRKK